MQVNNRSAGRIRRNIGRMLVALMIILACQGCATYDSNGRERSVLGWGTAIGAASGAIIGSQIGPARDSTRNAVIGGVVGGVAGTAAEYGYHRYNDERSGYDDGYYRYNNGYYR